MFARKIDERIAAVSQRLADAQALMPKAAHAFALDPAASKARRDYSNCRAACGEHESELRMLRDAREQAEEADRSAETIERRHMRVAQVETTCRAFAACVRLGADVDARLGALIDAVQAYQEQRGKAFAALNAYWTFAEYSFDTGMRKREALQVVLDHHPSAAMDAVQRLALATHAREVKVPLHDGISFSAASTDYARRIAKALDGLEADHV